MNRAVHLIIEGKVQGVGYRAWFFARAKDASLRGWVRNRRNGTVEAVISGEEETLSTFIKSCWRGPMAARVDNVTNEQYSRPVPPSFEVLPTI